MRVAIASSTPYAPPWSEGGRNLIRRLACEFEQRGISLTVITPGTPRSITHGEFGERIVTVGGVPGFPVRFRVAVQGFVWWSTAMVVRRLAAEIDVVLLMASLTSALGLRTALLKGLGGKPTVVFVTGLGRPRAGYRWGWRADRTLVGSEFLHQWLPGAGVVYPFRPHGLEFHSSNSSKQDGIFKVLFLGSLEPERGVEYLLQAMALARQQIDGQAKLVVAWNGEGAHNYENIQDLIDKLAIRPMVDWRGRVNTSLLYQEADVVVIPRVSQERMSFPIRIVEALFMQKPLIVSRICGMENLVQGCGLAVEPRDAHALADAILDLVQNPALRQEFVGNCPKAVQRFDDRVSLDRLLDELSKAIAI